ncbi:MAG: glycosyl hydrolase family 17 protein [Candidatus Paceibacterota bacterium]|jgi:exo-beta-1,3-glucanase (GH17 family)
MSIYYRTHGYCLGTCNIPEETYQRQLKTLIGRTKWIRGYALGGYDAHRMAKEMGFKTMVSAWIGREADRNERELALLIREAKEGYVDIAALGNEALMREEITDRDMAKYVERFKKAVPNIPVTVCDNASHLLRAPKVLAACDIISAHTYPYWIGLSIEEALPFTAEKHRLLQKTSGKEVIITETGWPSGGNTIGKAVANEENALRYFKEFVAWATRWNVRYFYFAPFDEKWKRAFEEEQGAHWGRWYEDGTEKPWVNWK